jgi:peptidyl-prolyl cis-trans isomerase B (cyclophilin B)
VKSKRGIVVTALLSVALLIPTTSSSADSREKKVSAPEKKIKCKVTSATAQSPMRIAAPQNVLKRAPKYLTLKTNCGDIVIETFFKQAPLTITAITTLARSGYFNKSLCHRLITEEMYFLSCGDPTATGSSGPEFSPPDENIPTAKTYNYSAGIVAMAKDPVTNKNSSQFFIVYRDTTLPRIYNIWGQVVSGLEIVKYIAQGGVKNGGVDGTPLRTIAIERAVTSNS